MPKYSAEAKAFLSLDLGFGSQSLWANIQAKDLVLKMSFKKEALPSLPSAECENTALVDPWIQVSPPYLTVCHAKDSREAPVKDKFQLYYARHCTLS